jgi:hypothetical protein
MGFIQLKLPKRIRHRIENSKQKARRFKGYDLPEYKPDPNQPKCSDKIPVGTGKKEEMRYSGERKLLGIGMMHKSNLVPIWDEEGAKEISTMRRN